MQIKIDKNKEVTGRLPFEPFAQFNDLCIGHITDVYVNEAEYKPEGKHEFAGRTILQLSISLQQYKLDANEKDRFKTIKFTPPTHVDANGVPREESKIITVYTQMWDKIKHLHDQFITNENYKPMDAIPEFNGSTLDERIAEFNKFFEVVVKDFKVGKDGTNPIYKPNQNLAMIMIASGDKKNYLDIPAFVGKGIFDLAKFKAGKIDTYLRIPVGQTTKLGVNATIATGGLGTNNAMSDLPEELRGLVN